MALVCRNCGTLNQDPGGDPGVYRCGYCGQPCLHRIQERPSPEGARLVGAIAVATAVGLATANPIGAILGGIAGYILGDRLVSR